MNHLTADDFEIRYTEKSEIYDLYVQGRFRNFFKTFGEAVMEIERLRSSSPVDIFMEQKTKGGKRR
jgi:hypothetical protein